MTIDPGCPRHRTIAFTLWILIAHSASPQVAQGQAADSLPLDVVLTQPSFPQYVPVSLSPDGLWVAYTLQSPYRLAHATIGRGYTPTGASDQSLGCTVWLTNVETGKSLRIGGGDSISAWAPQWSPDGHRLAFYSDETGVARLWVWDVATQAAGPVSDAIVRPYATLEGPRWTPDSRGVVTRILPYGSRIGDARTNPRLAGVSWDSTARAPGSTVIVYQTDSAWLSRPQSIPPTPTSLETNYVADLALIEVSTGAVTTLARGYRPFDYWVSPNGRFVAFASMKGMADGGPTGPRFPFDLVVVPIGSDKAQPTRVIATSVPVWPVGTGVAWAPDGNELAYAVSDTGAVERFYVVQSRDWKPRMIPVPDSLRGALAGRSFAQHLRWAPAGRTVYVQNSRVLVGIDVGNGTTRVIARAHQGQRMIALVGRAASGGAWLAEGNSLVVATRTDSSKRQGFARINIRTGLWTQLREEERFNGSESFLVNDVSADGRRGVFLSESATQPADLWYADSIWSKVRQITNVAPRLTKSHYGSTQLIEWHTATGEQVRGALLLPVNFVPGHRYPLIVYPYPTDNRSNDVYHFGLIGTGPENMQLFASRGYAVLAPSAPISTTDEMHSLADVILPGVDRVVAMGIADSARLGVMGHSWGGYTVLALLVQTTRFHAAVMRGGMGDLPAMYGEMEWSGTARGQILLEAWLGATMWENRSRFTDNSPVFFLDRVRTPLLIVHGGADSTVPPAAANEIFVDLRRLGQYVEYARYEGEDHVEAGWSYANQRDYLIRVLRWFDGRLRVRTGAGADSGSASIFH